MEQDIIDFNKCPLSSRNGKYGGMAGSKEGIIYKDDFWIIKYPKNTKYMDVSDLSYTTSCLSEYLGSHIYQILGYDVHETLLGIRNHKIIVACKDFCAEHVELREIRTLKNIYNEELQNKLDTELDSTDSSHIVDLNELLIHLDYNPVLASIPNLKERFWECVVIDLFINNNDRNNGNWGLLFADNHYSIAPIFDNGAAFSNKLGEIRIKNILSNPQKLQQSSLNVATAFGIDGKRLTLQKMLNYDNEDLKNAIKKVVPIIKNKMFEINKFIDDIPEKHNEVLICSQDRKNLYKKSMELRLEKGLEPALKRIIEAERPTSIKDRINNSKKKMNDINKEKNLNNKTKNIER